MRISVLTPTIEGRRDFLKRCTYSVRWQTWAGSMEHVVIDNTGHSPAEGFQRCLDQSIGALIVPLADDDWLAPHALQTLHDTIEGADFASGQTLIGGSNQVVGHALNETAFRDIGFDIGGAHIWRKTLTDRHGGFNPAFSNTADYELYWRLSKVATAAFVDEVLYFYTDHPATDGNTNGAAIAEQFDAIRKLHL